MDRAHTFPFPHVRTLDDFVRKASEQSVLDPEEELRLVERLDGGDGEALGDLVRPLVRVVIDEAIRHRGFGCPQAELIRHGMDALVAAARVYSPARDGALRKHVQEAVRAAMRETLDHH
jgi:DNA-directed RNA polymerase sigma subunit (sigma70/sigma32)